jgi:putative heme iron utilization protein
MATPVAKVCDVTAFPTDHVAPPEVLTGAAPLTPVEPAQTRTPAEEARTLVAQGRLAALSTLSDDGSPWGSLVIYAPLEDGTPILCLSTLAEHGRNVVRDSRASLVVGQTDATGDPLDSGRVTLAGTVEALEGDELEQARAAYREASPASALYGGFGDFTYYALRIERVRWVGGYGRMDSTDAAAYHAAEPDPVAPGAAYAISHLNEDHADALLDMARNLGGHPDATEAKCVRIDRYGLDMHLQTPRGFATTRIGFAEPASKPGDLRTATVELARRARAADA